MSLAPSSGSGTPLPLSSADPPTAIDQSPATLAFKTSLPQVLQPLSPQLAALYAARIRLLLDLPPENSRGWCCTKCGWLKDEYGWKVVKVKELKGKQAAPKAVNVESGKKGKGKGRKSVAGKGAIQPDISIPDIPLISTTSNTANQSVSISPSISDASHGTLRKPLIGVGARIPSCKPAIRNRQKSLCRNCGSAITLRPPSITTKAGFLSARRTRAIVDANGGDISVLPMANGLTGSDADGGGATRAKRTRAGLRKEAEAEADKKNQQPLEATGVALTAPAYDGSSTPSTVSGKPIVPDPIKASPKLAYIALADPEPATEQLPALSPSALPPPGEGRPAGPRNAVGFVNLGPAGGMTGKNARGTAGKKQSNLKTSTVSSQLVTPIPPVPVTKLTAGKNAAKPPPATALPIAAPPPKKKQKTGLAKLLADSKAREKESEKKKGSGLLSLDGADWDL
ncbi:hypothetical protein NliqN6_2896 [Naganishia liquefaciens]|uniref:Uncharacterized protein n=1 Tax=Naganishia liquefaciens TaxID=104408 RepID=A0A8H3TUP5_9TREE|nr:hypothetical protein NliqN6_2896 [Naganishia liquefaciens]